MSSSTSTLRKFGKWVNATTFLFTGNEDEPGILPEELREFSSVLENIETKYDTSLTLPDWLADIDSLKSISVKSYYLYNAHVIAKISTLTSLSIQVYNMDYTELAGCLPQLTYLRLENIQEKDLSVFSVATNLEILKLEECSTAIDFVVKLPKLKELVLFTGNPSVIVPEIHHIPSLTTLSINNSYGDKFNNFLYDNFNKSTGLAISKCVNLRHLSVHSNIVPYINFYGLQKLWDLRFVSGFLEFIPSGVLGINSLLSIIVNSSGIQEIPEDIYLLTKLQRLHIKNCDITYVPISIIKLKDLDELDLSSNKIEQIPIEIVSMPKLKTFNFLSNPISKDSIFYENSLLGVFKKLKQKEQDSINIGIIQMPEAIRNAVQEYLVYFDDYYEEISGKKVGFIVSKHEVGLKIEVELTQELDITSVQKALAKYTQYLLDKKFDVENNVEVDKLVKDLQILKLTLETKANHFDQQMKILELRHNIVNDENTYLRQIVATFASKDNVFVINQQTTNRNSPKLLNTNHVVIENNFSTEAFKDIVEILDAIGEDKELSNAATQVVESAQNGKRSMIASALSNFASVLTNSIDRAHIFLVDAPEVLEKLKKSLELAKVVATTHHYTEVAKSISNILNMF